MEKTTPAPVSCSGVIEKTMIIHHHNTDESDCTGDIKSDESRHSSTRGTFGVMNISSHLVLYPVNAAPTDGLWTDGRTDERQLGMSYEDLEKAMLNPKDKNYEKFLKIRKKNLNKMNLITVCKFNYIE